MELVIAIVFALTFPPLPLFAEEETEEETEGWEYPAAPPVEIPPKTAPPPWPAAPPPPKEEEVTLPPAPAVAPLESNSTSVNVIWLPVTSPPWPLFAEEADEELE
ncbi:hypothetical protein D0839_11960 [Bordetella avium]|nr:hypothetical protein C0J07_07230 [Bordetella avium]RIQ14204.1 hypothetical protein D0432_08110 [Bordetella avium]RIQ18079.1 hypothetical protein D0850_08040 [Bordetella avium]RIQ36550.1 hypothetical protein D0849_02515 [Bordetella avium]RIQ50110.1 hypothetical protein D0843_12200 [Bordetella avium]